MQDRSSQLENQLEHSLAVIGRCAFCLKGFGKMLLISALDGTDAYYRALVLQEAALQWTDWVQVAACMVNSCV